MDQSDPATPDTSMEVHDATNRRKSGRVRQAPVLLSKDPNISQNNGNAGKRKRTQLRGGDLPDASDEEEDEDIDEGESDPDEEELKERRRKASKKATSKPAPKKPKTAGPGTTKLAVRPAANGVGKPSKAQRSKARPTGAAAGDGTGLYCKCFFCVTFLQYC